MGEALFLQRKRDNQQEKTKGKMRPWEASENLLVKSVTFTLSDCCTCQSDAVKRLFGCHLNRSGPILRVSSLPNRKKRPKEPRGDGGNRSESAVLTDKGRPWFSLTPESSRAIPGSCPARFLDQKGPIWNQPFFKLNVLGERAVFSLLQSILPAAPCHCHTSNGIQGITKRSPISFPLGRSSRLFRSALLFSYCPGKNLGSTEQPSDEVR